MRQPSRWSVGAWSALLLNADRRASVVAVRDAGELGEHVAERLDLLGGEELLEQRADRRNVPARRVGELLASAVRQLGVRHAKIGVARCALDVPGVLQTLEQARHAGRREQQAAREVDA